jgi:hypothetical protein
MTRGAICILFCALFQTGFGQVVNIDHKISKVKTVIEQYEPCNTTILCFEYSFNVDKNKKELVIKTFRYNYEGNPVKKLLTETRICRLSIDQIEYAMFYPGMEQSFIIAMEGQGKIQQEVNGKRENSNMMILEFNDDFASKAKASLFKKDFNELVSLLKKQ